MIVQQVLFVRGNYFRHYKDIQWVRCNTHNKHYYEIAHVGKKFLMKNL